MKAAKRLWIMLGGNYLEIVLSMSSEERDNDKSVFVTKQKETDVIIC